MHLKKKLTKKFFFLKKNMKDFLKVATIKMKLRFIQNKILHRDYSIKCHKWILTKAKLETKLIIKVFYSMKWSINLKK